MNTKILLAGILAAIGIVGCDTEAAETKKNNTIMKEDHKQKLEESEAFDKASYFMKFATSTTPVKPNQNVTLSFVPRKKGSENEKVALEIEHEKKIHLIIVSEDLSYFNHIHPEMNDVGYTVSTSFPHPGTYTLFADYKPEGAEKVVDKLHVIVEGAAPKPKVYLNEKLTGSSGKYSFTIDPVQETLVAGITTHIYGIVKKDGKQTNVNSLEDYLGAKAHIVIVSATDKEYIHVHPMVKEKKLGIHAHFTKPGMYRGWVQFRDKQQLHTIDFTFKVVAGKEISDKNSANVHGHHDH
jgi:hypothetical protein